MWISTLSIPESIAGCTFHSALACSRRLQVPIRFAQVLGNLAEAVCDAETDVFVAANKLSHDIRFSDAAKAFSAKPGIFGFSIDLIKGASLLRDLYQRTSRRNHL
jgi:hypothetical protein